MTDEISNLFAFAPLGGPWTTTRTEHTQEACRQAGVGTYA
jgi:hypothetical protein